MKVKFSVSTGFVGSEKKVIVEVPNNWTDEQIQEYYNEWMWESIYAGWKKVDDGKPGEE